METFTRREKFLNAIATGSTKDLPDAITREEMLLGKIAKRTAGGGGGVNGKSAYESAVDGGYTGTETEFNEAMSNVANAGTGTVENINFGSEVV